MPQLMPLFWVVSNLFIMFFIFVSILIYSMSVYKVFSLDYMFSEKSYNWCW